MELKVKNFRNIKECSFDIIDNMLILVGKNGVGKSNVLEAIENRNFTISGSNEYDDIIYISPEISISESIDFEEDSVFMQLANILYDGESEDAKYQHLLNQVNLVLKENDVLKGKEVQNLENESLKKIFIKACYELTSGFKRRLLYQFLYKIATEALDKKLIILIDSPEVYAHPSMIRSICNELKFLSERGHLLIVSTHSAKVVETLNTDIRQVAKLTVKNNELVSYQIILDEYIKLLHEFYRAKNIFYLPNGRVNEALVHIVKNNISSFCKSFLRENVLKILFSDYIILGEGSSEEVLFNYMFTRIDYKITSKFADYNIDYVTGFGKFYLPFYFILANLYDVKVICMFDIDNLENKSHKAFYNAFSNYEINNKNLFITVMLDPDLESELEIEQSKHRVEKPLHIFNEVFYKKNNVNKIVNKIEKALNILE
ncbi:MAG: ATP-dependent nuclease [Bacilli bacterium]